VTPCLLLRCEQETAQEPALAVRELRAPAWWYYEPAGQPVEDARARRPRRRSAGKLPAVDVQTALPGFEPAPVVQPTVPPAAVLSPFASNKILHAQAPDASLRAKVVHAVDCLRSKGGSCSEAILAAALSATSWHIGPLLSRVEEVLNVDGYPVLRYDRAAKQVQLDVELLVQLFEIAP
jgi:hypothetical protein